MPSSAIAHGIPFREYQMAKAPLATATFYENFPRDFINADNAIGATTLMTMMAIPLYAGDVITSISVCVGATAGATLTHKFVALYDTSAVPARLGQSADDTGASMAANTVYTGTLTATVTIPSTGLYYAGICITGTTIPTLVGKTSQVNATAAAALNALISSAHLGVCVTSTGAASIAPATMASLTQLAVQPYVLLQ